MAMSCCKFRSVFICRTLYTGHFRASQGQRSSSNHAVLSSGFKLPADVKRFEDIPGPGGLPYFGTYFKYKTGGANVNRLFDTVRAWHQQYGPVFKETCLGKTVLHVAEAEAIRSVYSVEGQHPRIEPLAQPSMYYRQQKGISLGLGNTNNEEWYHLRHAAQMLMMRPAKTTHFLTTTDQTAQDFVVHLRSVRNASMEVSDFGTQLGRWVLETFGAHCFNTRLGYLTEEGRREAGEVMEANDRLFQSLTQLHASLPVFQSTHIATPKWRNLFAAEDFLYEVFLKHFNSALGRLKEKTDRGKLDEGDFCFIRHLMSQGLSFNDVAILTHSLLFDPLPTVGSQLQFLLYLLAINPQVQDRLCEEVQSMAPLSSSPLASDCIRHLPYFRACFKESIRMMPLINENKRFTQSDVVLGGYHVPADTLVYMNNFTLFRNPDIFTDPDVFMPERWLQKNWKKDIDPMIVQPFSFGPRMCIGRRFAEQDMAVLMIRLLQNFRVEWHQPPMGIKYQILNVPDCPAHFTFCDR